MAGFRSTHWFGILLLTTAVLAVWSSAVDENDNAAGSVGISGRSGPADITYDANHYNYGSENEYDDDEDDDTTSPTGDTEVYEDNAADVDADDADAVFSAKSGYSSRQSASSSSKKRRVYVPVFVPEHKKKKMKIIAVDKGFYIPGGTQLFGRFLTLKNCMKACGDTPTCFSADYNPWLKKCYQHSNFTACNTRKSHPQFVHFSKVPCTIIDAPAGKVTLGASMSGGVIQKGIDTITECIKKCVSAGGGVQPTVAIGDANAANAFARQSCFAIDFDFSKHQCYFFGTNLWTVPFPTSTTGVQQVYGQIFFHCPITVTGYQSLNTIPNPNVVHITFCPLPVG